MSVFKDHFSGHAADYRASRPGYPPALFAWLAEAAPRRGLAVDLGCGNGQATLGLAEHFAAVIGVEPSAAQVAQAPAHPRVTWRTAPAEATGLPDGGADLLLAAQALHWFDHPRFYAELRRIAAPGALFAAVAYGLCHVAPAVDQVVDRLYEGIVGPYWPPERAHVASGYRTIPFPLTEVAVPIFAMEERWSLARFADYLGTWSAVKAYQRATGSDPLALVADDLRAAWGAGERTLHWPLAIRAGRL